MKKFLCFLVIGILSVVSDIFFNTFGGVSIATMALLRPTVPVETYSKGSNGLPVVATEIKSATESIVRMDGELNMFPDVPSMTQVITSASGGGALTQTAYFLNEDIFNETPTNNGSGAGTITNTYGDGWAGNGYNNLAKALSFQNGIKCYGFTLEYITTSTGAENPAGLAVAQPTWLMGNLVGNRQIPKGFVLPAGKRNTQYLTGTMTLDGIFYLNALCQFSYGIPVGNTVTLVILNKPLV